MVATVVREQHEEYLTNVFEDVVNSFNNPKLKELIRNESYIAGGCLRSLYMDEKINDYDFYFRTKQSAAEFKRLVNLGLEGKLAGSPLAEAVGNDQGFSKENMRLKYRQTTENALTFKFRSSKTTDPVTTVQFIIKYSGDPMYVINHFDFTHSMAFFDPIIDTVVNKYKRNKIQVSGDFLEACSKKVLHFNPHCHDSLSTLARIDKFTKKGWHIDWQNLRALLLIVNANYTTQDIKRFEGKGAY